MTKSDYTAVCLVIDASGSMEVIKGKTEEGVNSFIAAQAAAEGKTTIRLATFGTAYNLPGWLRDSGASVPASEVAPFVLMPIGGTPLLDAIGVMLTRFGQELADLPEDNRPAHVVFAVMTDGYENRSQEFTQAQVAQMVTHQQDVYGWEIVYLGANQDAIAEAAQLGVRATNSLTYTASDAGVTSSMRSMTSYVDTVRGGGQAAFSATDRSAALDGE